MKNGVKIMDVYFTYEQAKKVMDVAKGKKLTQEQRIKFSKAYSNKIK